MSRKGKLALIYLMRGISNPPLPWLPSSHPYYSLHTGSSIQQITHADRQAHWKRPVHKPGPAQPQLLQQHRQVQRRPDSCRSGFSGIGYSTVQYNIVQYSTAQNRTTQNRTVQYSTVQYRAVQNNVAISKMTKDDKCWLRYEQDKTPVILGDYDRPTTKKNDQPTDLPTGKLTNQPTYMRVHGEVKLLMTLTLIRISM